jgi:hypothetical protein
VLVSRMSRRDAEPPQQVVFTKVTLTEGSRFSRGSKTNTSGKSCWNDKSRKTIYGLSCAVYSFNNYWVVSVTVSTRDCESLSSSSNLGQPSKSCDIIALSKFKG